MRRAAAGAALPAEGLGERREPCVPAGISQRPLLSLPARRAGRRAGADSERHRRRRRFARDVAASPHSPRPPGAGSAGTLGGRELPGENQGSPARQGMLGEAGVGQEWLEEGRSNFTAIIPLFGEAGTGKFPPAGRLTPWNGKCVSARAGPGLRGCSWAAVGWGGFECCFRNTRKVFLMCLLAYLRAHPRGGGSFHLGV